MDERLEYLSPWATRTLMLLRSPVEAHLHAAARDYYGPGYRDDVATRLRELRVRIQTADSGSKLADQRAALVLLRDGEFVHDSGMRELADAVLAGRDDVSHRGISGDSLDRMLTAGRRLADRLDTPALGKRFDGLRRSFEALCALPVTVGRDPSQTLFVVPCSGHKVRGGLPKPRKSARSVLGQGRLSPDMAHQLRGGRDKHRRMAGVVSDEFRPACERYGDGSLWRAAPNLPKRLTAEHHVLILSGAYGVVLWDEPIEWYDLDIGDARWRAGLLGEAIADYARTNGVQEVVAFGSATKPDYAEIVRGAPWERAGVDRVTVIEPMHFEERAAESDRTVGVCLERLIEFGSLDARWTVLEAGVHVGVDRLDI